METITISPINKNHTKHKIHSKHVLLNQREVIVDIFPNKVIISSVGIDSTKNIYKTGTSKNQKTVFVCNRYIEKGKYIIDESESDVDTIVFYFEDKL